MGEILRRHCRRRARQMYVQLLTLSSPLFLTGYCRTVEGSLTLFSVSSYLHLGTIWTNSPLQPSRGSGYGPLIVMGANQAQNRVQYRLVWGQFKVNNFSSWVEFVGGGENRSIQISVTKDVPFLLVIIMIQIIF